MKDSSFYMKINIDELASSQPFLTHLIINDNKNISLTGYTRSVLETKRDFIIYSSSDNK